MGHLPHSLFVIRRGDLTCHTQPTVDTEWGMAEEHRARQAMWSQPGILSLLQQLMVQVAWLLQLINPQTSSTCPNEH